MAEFHYWTTEDVLDHLRDVEGAASGRGTLRQIKRAILNSYRDFPADHNWQYYNGRGRVTTNASYNTGTVAYDHTGGTYERQLTLTSGTWPSWAAAGVVEISSVHYRVDRRISDTVLTLDDALNPGADVASGTSYTLAQYAYPLEEDYGGGGQFFDLSKTNWVEPSTMENWIDNFQSIGFTSEPYRWTIMGDPDNKGRMALFLVPAPSTSRTYDYIYRRVPLPLRWFSQPASTITATTSGTTVTASSAYFNARMVGAVIRFAEDDATAPQGLEDESPFDHERVITAFTSTTAVEVNSAISGDLGSGVLFSVHDLIDVRASTMYTAFLRKCEAELARLRNDEKAEMKEAAYLRELRKAVGNDYHRTIGDVPHSSRFEKMRDYAIISND